jgi:glycosyltransferase involved in cell wall biosynthesis
MKLGLVVPGGFDPSGRAGVIPALLALTRELAQRHDVRVFASGSFGGAASYRLHGASIHQLGGAGPGRGGPGLPGLTAALARWIRDVQRSGRLELLHAFWADDAGLLAVLAARWLGIPSVVSIGGGEVVWLPEIPYGGAGTVGGRLRVRMALGLAGAVTAGSRFAAERMPASAAARVRLVPLGVPCDDGGGGGGGVARPGGPPWRMVHVASINRVKDHETLLAAFRRVVDRMGDAELDWVGEDTLGEQAQRRAQELGLGARVRFHGFVANDMLPAFYGGAHLHVLSSRYESQGVVVLEAAAAGLPTVGTAVGLLPELAPRAARCVPPGDAAALADAICALLADTAAREALGAEAQRFARAHDAAWTARAFEEIYLELKGSRSSGRAGG